MTVCAYVYYEGDPALSIFSRYVDIVRYSLNGFGGRLLVQDGNATSLRGELGSNSYKLLIEFPHRRAAQDWYQSALVSMLLDKAILQPDGNMVVMEGVH